MAKALSRPIDNLIRIPGNINEIFDDIFAKEEANKEADLVQYSIRVSNICYIEKLVKSEESSRCWYEHTKMAVLKVLHELKYEGGIPVELAQVLSIDDFLALSTYNIEERMNILMCKNWPIMSLSSMSQYLRENEKNAFEGADRGFTIFNKSLQKAHSISQKFASVGPLLSQFGIEIDGVLDIIYDYLEGFGANDSRNALSKFMFCLNDRVPQAILKSVGDCLDINELECLYDKEGSLFRVLDPYFGGDDITMFSTLPLKARSIVLDYTAIGQYYICDTPAILGEVDAPSL